MPCLAQLAQGADLCVSDEASTKIGLRVRTGGCHSCDGHIEDLVAKWAERTAVGFSEQNPSKRLVVNQRVDERLEPRLWRLARPGWCKRIDTLRHHRNGMVDNSALEFGKRGKVLVEVPLGESRSQTDPTDAECARPLGSSDLEGGRYQPVSSIDTPVVSLICRLIVLLTRL